MKKIAAGTYRDLQQRWDSIKPKFGRANKAGIGRLMCVTAPDGLWLFPGSDVRPIYDESAEDGQEKKAG